MFSKIIRRFWDKICNIVDKANKIISKPIINKIGISCKIIKHNYNFNFSIYTEKKDKKFCEEELSKQQIVSGLSSIRQYVKLLLKIVGILRIFEVDLPEIVTELSKLTEFVIQLFTG